MDFDFISFILTQLWSIYIFIGKIHPNTEMKDSNLSPSKVVTFLYIGRYVHVSDLVLIPIMVGGGYICTHWAHL